MKQTLSKLLSILLIASLLLAFCSCVKIPDEQPDEPLPDTPKVVTFKVTYTAGKGGSILGQAEQTVEKGNYATSVYALADIGYTFEKWSDGLTSPSRQDFDVQQDISVTALFTFTPSPVYYSVRYFAASGGYIVGNSIQSVEQGQNAEAVTAVADEGYTFEKWSDGLTSATRQDCNVQETITLTAIFTEISAQKTVTFELDYKYGVVANPIDNVTFVEDEVSATVLPIPTRERFTFGGWYVGEMQVTDNNGAILVGNEILDSNETVIYAKWTAKETHTFKVLMIYVTSVQARIHSINGNWVDVDYSMSAEEEQFFRATTKRLSSYCYDMLDGLVDFQFDEYYTTQTITEVNIEQAPIDQGNYRTHLRAYNIPEVRALLPNYDSCIVVFGLQPTFSSENLFFDYHGISETSYAEVCLDSIYTSLSVYDITLEQMTESMTNCTEIERYGMVNMVFNTWLSTIIHEMAHTIELRFGRDTLHNALGTTTFVNHPKKMKEFYLNELVVDGEKNGIPYDVWARNFVRITLITNDKVAGYTKFNRYFSKGTLIDPVNNLTDRYYEEFIGKEITISAKPNSGYKLTSWSDGDTNLTRTITITADLTLTATFELAEYTITVCPCEGGRVDGYFIGEDGKTVYINDKMMTGVVKKGYSQMFVSVMAYDGYQFVGWSNGETSYELNFTFKANTKFPVDLFDETYTLTLTPIFEKIEE